MIVSHKWLRFSIKQITASNHIYFPWIFLCVSISPSWEDITSGVSSCSKRVCDAMINFGLIFVLSPRDVWHFPYRFTSAIWTFHFEWRWHENLLVWNVIARGFKKNFSVVDAMQEEHFQIFFFHPTKSFKHLQFVFRFSLPEDMFCVLLCVLDSSTWRACTVKYKTNISDWRKQTSE